MKNVALFESIRKPEALEYLKLSAKLLNSLGCSVIIDPKVTIDLDINEFGFINSLPTEEFGKIADLVISFGGDGTMLSAARQLIDSQVPIMGVNVGRLGFLAEYSVEDLESTIKDYVNGNYRLVERSVIETYINDERVFALNDIVLEKKGSSKLITVKAYSNGNHIGDYRADGLIVCTPTGSTAYSLSCGGPILSPSTQVLCLTPISPHTLTLRPLVLPDTIELTLIVNSSTGMVNFVCDGQVEYTIADGTSITIKKSESRIKLIKPLGSSYYDLLKAKLLWATDGSKK
ncbi:MAG: NAD(+)/NADH kinase [Candidatus Kapabacteria bacterium]|nr:NAD(+)/NADH kinase [Candidatus Kapabacteria bacterium]